MTIATLRDYDDGDLWLQQRLLGDPAVMTHLGGPESPEAIERRHERLLRMNESGAGRMLVVETTDGEVAGSVGYWERDWRDELVWEAGWLVLPAFHGRGIATVAVTAVLERIRESGRGRPVHAFPSLDNAASNAICARTGFALLGPVDFEYPAGHPMRCNDWRWTGATS